MKNPKVENVLERKWLASENEVREFHMNYFGGQMISVSVSDLRKLVKGNFMVWISGFEEYSEVLQLDDNVKILLEQLLGGN